MFCRFVDVCVFFYIIKEEKLEKFNIDKKGQSNKWPNKVRKKKNESYTQINVDQNEITT